MGPAVAELPMQAAKVVSRPPVEHQPSYVTLLLALQGQRACCVLYVASALALELLARLRG